MPGVVTGVFIILCLEEDIVRADGCPVIIVYVVVRALVAQANEQGLNSW